MQFLTDEISMAIISCSAHRFVWIVKIMWYIVVLHLIWVNNAGHCTATAAAVAAAAAGAVAATYVHWFITTLEPYTISQYVDGILFDIKILSSISSSSFGLLSFLFVKFHIQVCRKFYNIAGNRQNQDSVYPICCDYRCIFSGYILCDLTVTIIINNINLIGIIGSLVLCKPNNNITQLWHA